MTENSNKRGRSGTPELDHGESSTTTENKRQRRIEGNAVEAVANLDMKLNTHFSSFIILRNAIDKYQKENHVQLVVKDSKLLSAESTKKVIPKVFHLVNKSLMYHSITYCCKCHGELRQKPGSRIKNVGAKRLNCPMYLRFKLSTDLQSLVLFDMLETHNHLTDPNTFQLSPRQQIYRVSRIERGEPDPGAVKQERLKGPEKGSDMQALIATAIKDVNSVSSLAGADDEPPAKAPCLPKQSETSEINSQTRGHKDTDEITATTNSNAGDDSEENEDSEEDSDDDLYRDNPDSPMDYESSCSDSDEEEIRRERYLLPFPMRLFGSAVRCSPELQSLTKELIESEKEKLISQKKLLIVQTRYLELKNKKLSLEVKHLEKNLVSGTEQPTTFYLQN